MLVNIVTQYQEAHQVSIVATCASINAIGRRLKPARGCHFFTTVLSIPNLEKVFNSTELLIFVYSLTHSRTAICVLFCWFTMG